MEARSRFSPFIPSSITIRIPLLTYATLLNQGLADEVLSSYGAQCELWTIGGLRDERMV